MRVKRHSCCRLAQVKNERAVVVRAILFCTVEMGKRPTGKRLTGIGLNWQRRPAAGTSSHRGLNKTVLWSQLELRGFCLTHTRRRVTAISLLTATYTYASRLACNNHNNIIINRWTVSTVAQRLNARNRVYVSGVAQGGSPPPLRFFRLHHGY